MSEKQIKNIAFYKFVELKNLEELKTWFASFTNQVRGTILLAKEGINAFIAGTTSEVDAFMETMANDARFHNLDIKVSFSDTVPFRRMNVRLKKEIISMGHDEIEPEKFTGDYVDSLDLKKWLDENQDVIMLDTRNDYEVEVGTFKGAINPNIKTFRKFPEWIKENFADYKDKKIVTFCTGGIRCEKATAFMRQEGFDNVYQLKGGILKYFEDVGQESPHYDGDCFVFDHRVALNPDLDKSSYTLCFGCWGVLTEEDLKSPLYVPEKHCPKCATQQQKWAQERIERGQKKYWASMRKILERKEQMRAKWGRKPEVTLLEKS